jgi:hypothetical protein
MTFSLTWLADELRAADLQVVEVHGWETRGLRDLTSPVGVICHHTGGSLSGNAPSLQTVINGRTDLHGPLAQLFLARDGTFHVVAASVANHAGPGNWNGNTEGNLHFIGIEAQNTGFTTGPLADPWPAVQMKAYVWGVAAILNKIGAPAFMCCGHKEYALPKGRKPDPTFDMDTFRELVGICMGLESVLQSPLLQTFFPHVGVY